MEFVVLFFKDDFNLVIFVFDLKPTIQLELKGSTVVSLYWYHFFWGMNTAKNTNKQGNHNAESVVYHQKWGWNTQKNTHKKKYTKSQNFHCWIPPRNFVFFYHGRCGVMLAERTVGTVFIGTKAVLRLGVARHASALVLFFFWGGMMGKCLVFRQMCGD